MTEYRLVSFMQPTADLLGQDPGGVKVMTVNFTGSLPALAEYVDGWEVINSQIVPAGEYTYLTLMLRTDVAVPDSPGATTL